MIETFSLRYILNMFCVCLNSSKNRTECVQNYIWGNNWDNKNTQTICPRTFWGGKQHRFLDDISVVLR